MNKYSYKHHIAISIIVSCFIGLLSFFTIKPSHFGSVTGVLQSNDSNYIYTHTSYGYETVIIIFIISLFIILALYKPLSKLINKIKGGYI